MYIIFFNFYVQCYWKSISIFYKESQPSFFNVSRINITKLAHIYYQNLKSAHGMKFFIINNIIIT
jgi:hypothetical protein